MQYNYNVNNEDKNELHLSNEPESPKDMPETSQTPEITIQSGPQDVSPVTIQPETAAYNERPEPYNTESAQAEENNESVRENKWCEAAYSTVDEAEPEMYTPGINTHQFYSQKKPRPSVGNGKKKKSGLLRAVCLVLICTVLSGAASYGVMEYRIRRGDLTPVNQVVLGGASKPQGDLTTPLASAGDYFTGQEIYDTACTQVVTVKTDVPGMGGLFGSQSTVNTVSGSGFIISDDGYILTNHHVIEPAYKGGLPLSVVMNDGTEYEGTIVGFEESNDVAVIKINATALNAAVIGDSDSIRVGQQVFAVGNPFGELVYTMTDGIVSGLNRVVSVDNKSISTFQINAAVNSGNSGGPVYNNQGEVIGIVTAKFMRTSVEGIGFAIPINDAIELAMDLVENGYITGKAFMGISVRTFTKAFAEFYQSVEGAYVVTVTPGSAADKSGIKVGDIITKVGEFDVISEETLLFAKQKFKAGETTPVIVRRSGEDIELSITFDEDTSWLQQETPQSEPQNSQELPAPGR